MGSSPLSRWDQAQVGQKQGVAGHFEDLACAKLPAAQAGDQVLRPLFRLLFRPRPPARRGQAGLHDAIPVAHEPLRALLRQRPHVHLQKMGAEAGLFRVPGEPAGHGANQCRLRYVSMASSIQSETSARRDGSDTSSRPSRRNSARFFSTSFSANPSGIRMFLTESCCFRNVFSPASTSVRSRRGRKHGHGVGRQAQAAGAFVGSSRAGGALTKWSCRSRDRPG